MSGSAKHKRKDSLYFLQWTHGTCSCMNSSHMIAFGHQRQRQSQCLSLSRSSGTSLPQHHNQPQTLVTWTCNLTDTTCPALVPIIASACCVSPPCLSPWKAPSVAWFALHKASPILHVHYLKVSGITLSLCLSFVPQLDVEPFKAQDGALFISILRIFQHTWLLYLFIL